MLATTHRRSTTSISLLLSFVLVLGGFVHHQTAHATELVQVIDTSMWDPPSPDPSGITYWPANNRLVIVDGEVEEMSIYEGKNLFISTLSGNLTGTYDTTHFTNEPVGIDIAVQPGTNDFFISDDSAKNIYVVEIGSSGVQYQRHFSTLDFGNADPEGLTFGDGSLFTVDGAGRQVFRIGPGPNGIFDGVAPDGDDEPEGTFDVEGIGVRDPEGIEYDPETGTLYIVDRKRDQVVETTISGNLIRVIDLRFTGINNPGDLTLAPASSGGGRSLYIAARGVDNNSDPNENDGKIYEITLDSAPGSTNLLANPGFEADDDGNGPDDWKNRSMFTRSAGDAGVSPQGGSYMGRFHATDNSSATVLQKVNNISGGENYTASGWVNIPPTNDSFKFRVEVRWRDGKSKLRTDVIGLLEAPTGGWVQMQQVLNAPGNADNAQFRLVAKKIDSTIFVDDMVLQR